MNMRMTSRLFTWLAIACLASADATAQPIGNDVSVYHVGNSLTFSLSLDRLDKLFESQGGNYDYGTQMGAGIPLNAHLVNIHAYTREPFKKNDVESGPYGNDYGKAFANHQFDAVILQPYSAWLETDDYKKQAETRGNTWHENDIGDHQAIDRFIEIARGDNEKKNQTTDRFFIYGTWPRLVALYPPRGETKTFADHWASEYDATVPSAHWNVPTQSFQRELVKRVNADHSDLKTPVRLIPVGDVLAKLDVMIREDKLPGVEAYFMRETVPTDVEGNPVKTWKGEARSNQEYYRTGRRQKDGSLVKGFPFEEVFVREHGVVNLYADLIHLNDQPHAGATDGTLGTYIAAITMYTVFTGQSPVGLTTAPWERIDPEADAELVKAVQQVVWDTVTSIPETGVTVEQD